LHCTLTVIFDPAAAVLTSAGVVVTVYPEFASPLAASTSATAVLTSEFFAPDGSAARTPADAAPWTLFLM
jgi:hypothetical protein